MKEYKLLFITGILFLFNGTFPFLRKLIFNKPSGSIDYLWLVIGLGFLVMSYGKRKDRKE